MRGSGGLEDRQLACGFIGVGEVGRGERSRGLELGEQQPDAIVLRAGAIVGAGARRLQQLGDGALVNVGILAQIEAGEMEAEPVDRAAQSAQPPVRQRGRAVVGQRAMQDVEVGDQLGGSA